MAVSCRATTTAIAPMESLQVFVWYTRNQHARVPDRPGMQTELTRDHTLTSVNASFSSPAPSD
jgi:hypothetical protein